MGLHARWLVLAVLGWAFAGGGVYPAPADEGDRFLGVVVDSRGRAVEDAHVWLYRQDTRTGQWARLTAEAVTQHDGGFSLADPESAALGWRGRRWGVFAWAAGYALAEAETTYPDEPLCLCLEPPWRQAGTVLENGDQPVVGAAVTILCVTLPEAPNGERRTSRLSVPREVSERLATRTDRDGRFVLSALPHGALADVEVAAPGHAAIPFEDQGILTPLLLGPTEDLPRTGGAIRGRVIGHRVPEGLSAPQVHYGSWPDTRPGAYGFCPIAEDGSFVIADLPSGSYRLGCQQAADAAYVFAQRWEVLVRPGEETQVELTALETVPVSGRIVDGETGAGIPKADMSASWPEESCSVELRTDAEGRFGFRAPLQRLRVWVRPPPPFGQLLGEPRTVPAPPATDLGDLALARGPLITVVTLDGTGERIPWATVEVDGRPLWPRQKTDAKGELAFTPQPNPGLLSIEARKGELATARPTVLQQYRADQRVEVVLKPHVLCGLTAKLLDQDGEPAKGAWTMLFWQEEGRDRYGTIGPADDDGVAKVSGLRPHRAYALRVGGGAFSVVRTDWWRGRPGKVHDLGTVVLRRHRGSVAGTVAGPDGHPLAGALVSAHAGTAYQASDRTDAQGRFRVGRLPAGKVLVYVERPGGLSGAALANTGDRGVRIVAGPIAASGSGQPFPVCDAAGPDPPGKALAAEILHEAILQSEPLRRRAGAAWGVLTDLWALYARVDPHQATAVMGDGISDRAARSAAGQALLSIDFAKGLALIQEAESDRRLPEVLLGAAEQALVGGDRALALRCVDEALAASDPDGNGSRPLLRCSLRARAGRILLALGDARAEGLLRHAETDARRLTDAGVRGAEPARWVGEVAACLCALDPGAAVGILVSERTPTEAVVSVAQQIAPTDPDRALVLAREHDQRVATRGRGGPSAADSPALPDVLAFLPAARFHQALQLARGIGSPRTRARIFCQLAAVGPPDRVGALLAEAAEAAAPAPGQSYRAEEVLDLARIALVAARVGSPDYKRLALRAVAAYPRPLAAYPDHPFGIADDGRLAQMLALGSPELSRAILEWALRCTGGVGGVDGESYDELASAAVAIDVQWGLDLLGQMPPDTDIGPYARLHRAPAALAIAAQLVTPPEDHETALLREQGRESWVPVDPCLGELARCRAPGP